MSTANELEFAVEDYLYNLFVTQSGAGGKLGVQTNPDGSTGLKFQGRSCPAESNIFPNVGVEFDTYTNDVFGTRRDAMIGHLDIVLAVLQPFSPTVADTRQQARLNLRNYVSDGTGNGLSPLLRGPDRTLGGLVSATWIETLQFGVYKGRDSTAGTIASAYYRFAFKALVSW